MKKTFTVVVERDPESSWLVGEVVELPGCYTEAADLPTLETNIHEAISVYLETAEPDDRGERVMVRIKRRFVVDEQGRKKSVLLPVKEYEELLEDLQDLALKAERNEESAESLEVIKKRLETKWKSTKSR